MSADRRAVSSTKNPLVQRFRAAAAGDVAGVLLAEGVRLLAEALDAKMQVLEVAVSPRCADAALRARLQSAAAAFVECSDAVLASLSALETPQGVAALLARPVVAAADLVRGRAPSHWVVLSRAAAVLEGLRANSGWRALAGRAGVGPWTDDNSNLLRSIRWK